MIQSLLLTFMILLSILLIVSVLRKPFDNTARNPCRFKILPPKFNKIKNKEFACFNIIVEKQHRYFINFPLLFKFYSDSEFKTKVKILYTTPGEEEQLLLDKVVHFSDKTKEFITYITDVIMGKITIQLELDSEYGKPIVGFEILENATCELMKEHKIELIFP